MRFQQNRLTITCAMAALLLATGGCNSTSLTTTWKDPSATSLNFSKVAVIVVNTSPAERRAQEDALAAEIKRAAAVPSYQLISDDQLKDVPAAKAKIIAEGFDGAVLVRMIDARQHQTYVPPTYSDWGTGWGPPPYPGSAGSPGYVMTDTIVRAEISLFSVPAGKLLWAGASETLNPADARAFATEVARAAAAELRKQGLLQ